MADPNTNRRTEAPAKAAGICFVLPDGRALFLKRAGDDHTGEWCFPGGGVEAGETAEQAACRESREEIGALPYGARKELAVDECDGVHYTTFRQPILRAFTPRLNGEHSEYVWAPLDEPPQPLHPGVARTLQGPATTMASDEARQALRRAPGLAFDRASVRRIDQDGRLHVELTNISKAAVNGYLGSEIPDAEALGLDPDRIYQLLRDPAELEKGAPTFNAIPLLSKHIPVSAQDHQPGIVVGATGTDAVFEAPYLKNSLVVWAADAIQGINSEQKRELSCAYRYTADMTPGTFEGTPYDGVMRNIVGNHVALVATGRAGPDVIVGDSQLKRNEAMKSKPLSRHAVLAMGALIGSVTPMLAADAKPDFLALLSGVNARNWSAKKAGIAHAIRPMLASDADISDVVGLLDQLNPNGATEDQPQDIADAIDADPLAAEPVANPAEAVLAMLRGKITDEDLAAVEAAIQALLNPAADADPVDPMAPAKPVGAPDDTNPFTEKEDGMNKPKPAMDAASVNKMIANAADAVQRRAREAAEAREVVRPFVGQVAVALDSAEAVYKAALELRGVKTDGIHPSALRAVLEAQPSMARSASRSPRTRPRPATS